MTSFSSLIRLLLLFLLGLFILLFFYLGLYLPKNQSLIQLQQQTSGLEKRLQTLKDQQQTISTLIRQKEIQQTDISSTVLAEFPTTAEVPKLLASWSQESKKIGIEFLLFEPLPEIALGPLTEVPIQVTLRGTFHQTIKFFNYLSLSDQKILLSNIEMKHPERKKGNTVISTSAMITTFRRGSD